MSANWYGRLCFCLNSSIKSDEAVSTRNSAYDIIGTQEVTRFSKRYLKKHMNNYNVIGEGRGSFIFTIPEKKGDLLNCRSGFLLNISSLSDDAYAFFL